MYEMLKLSKMEDPCIFILGTLPGRRSSKEEKFTKKKMADSLGKQAKGAGKIGLVNVNQASQILEIFLYFPQELPSDLGISNNALMFSRFSIANVTFKAPLFKRTA
ncbi:hypothetical protein AVEN_261083-1 [Araneus ventricosus]|uniref:Uncharacterized protein n=1 Tax=Araneus ventricosus TaxID=182803 RepID=A0A4Y2RG62_ARAVE|nr:hypothetical protein AVEN_261083-1 [Araneus ventricosus]